MIIFIKDETVHIGEINDHFLTCLNIVFKIYQKYNKIPVLTSCNDAIHHPNSWHYKNLAWDFRIWGIDDPDTEQIDEMMLCAVEIKIELQSIDEHFVVLYGDDKHKDHMHIEYNFNKIISKINNTKEKIQ